MRIGFFGNPNNYPFMLARACRRLGHEVVFIVVSPERLNRPEFRYADIQRPYPDWILDLTPAHRWSFLLPGAARRQALAALNRCDLCFLAEEGPALAGALRPPHVALLTGSNLEVFADPAQAATLKPQVFPRHPLLNQWSQSLLPTGLLQALLVQPQREGIRRARLVAHPHRGVIPNGDRLLDALGVGDSRRDFFLMTDLDLVRLSPPPMNEPLRIFCVARLTWKHEPGDGLVDLDYKGTDILLRGFALLRQRGVAPLPELHLVRKGRHVAETVALADELGIAHAITWLDELSQTEVLAEYARADIVVDQLATSVVAMGGLDAMASGRPLIANLRPDALRTTSDQPNPVCQAGTAEEVCAQLARLTSDAALRAELGQASRRYVETHFSSDVVAARLLQQLALSP